MIPFLLGNPANASSDVHSLGRDARAAVEAARSAISDLLSSRPMEVVFTSGATESNNLAILGSARAAPRHRRRVVMSAVEHKCVLGTQAELRRLGFEVVIAPVLSDGTIDFSALVRLINSATWLVSVQAASNEVGTIQPIREIASIVHASGAIFHCDAAQAAGRIEIDVNDWGVDLLSASAHKMYGPKGVGALFVRDGVRGAPIAPLFFGGGQEWGLRSGTLNVPGIVGFGRACEVASEEAKGEQPRIAALRDSFERQILSRITDVTVNGNLASRLSGNSSLTFAEVDSEALIANAPGLAVSSGAACASGAPEPSHVLLAIGLSRALAYSTLRIGIGRFTTAGELTASVDVISRAVDRIRCIPAGSGTVIVESSRKLPLGGHSVI